MEWRELLNLIFAVSFILVGKLADHLDEHPSHYACPSYCDIDHIHFTSKEIYEVPQPNSTNHDSLYIISDSNRY